MIMSGTSLLAAGTIPATQHRGIRAEDEDHWDRRQRTERLWRFARAISGEVIPDFYRYQLPVKWLDYCQPGNVWRLIMPTSVFLHVLPAFVFLVPVSVGGPTTRP
jgi:hypothetical protein